MERIVSGVRTRRHHLGLVCADKRVLDSFVHPWFCGFLVEFVETA